LGTEVSNKQTIKLNNTFSSKDYQTFLDLGQRTKPSRTSNASNSTATCYSNAFDNKSYAPLVYLTKADKNG